MVGRVKVWGSLLIFLVVSLILSSIIIEGNISTAAESSHESAELVVVTVVPGDTLWSIAREHLGGCSTQDPRKLVYEIRQINNLESALIHPGQALYIPITH